MRRNFLSILIGIALSVGVLRSDAPLPGRSQVTIALMGDVMLGRGIAQAHLGGGWEAVFSPIAAEVSRADVAFANLESPITTAPLERPTYDLRAPAVALAALTSAGFDFVSLANNHVEDSGARGLLDTEMALGHAGLIPVGPDLEPAWMTVKGHPLAFLAVDDVSVAANIDTVAEAIHAAKQRADWVIVSVHWGGEYSPGANAEQNSAASRWVQAGADVIVGHHPHVLQPVRTVQPAGESRTALVAYSLGNAVFDQPAPPGAMQSAALVVTLDRGGVSAVRAIPFRIDWKQGVVSSATVEESASILGRLGLQE